MRELLLFFSHCYPIVTLQVCSEDQRFEKLMEHFKNEDNNIDFMVCVRPASKYTHFHLQSWLLISVVTSKL